MWIERIELAGFGATKSEKVEFARSSVNLFEEITDQTKLLAPAAVLAALYGIRSDSSDNLDALLAIQNFQNLGDNSGTFSVSLDLVIGGKSLRVLRNLEDNRFLVYDRSSNNADLTGEFSQSPGDVGEIVTGLNRQQFSAGAFALAPIASPGLLGHKATLELLEHALKQNSPTYKEALAVQTIDDSLSQYPFGEVTIRIDFLIAEMERQQSELNQQIETYRTRRRAVIALIERLQELEPILEGEEKQLAAQEYFRLCLRAAETDGTVMQLRSQQIRIKAIERELARLGSMDEFTAESQAQIEELWIRRTSRIQDYRALEAEIMPKLRDLEIAESGRSERWHGMEGFTREQVQALTAMASNFKLNEKEIKEFREKLSQEEKSARSLQLDPERFERSRQVMLSLDQREIGDAKSLLALLTGYKNQAVESERGKTRAEALIEEIDDQKQGKGDAAPMFKLFKQGTMRQRELEGARADWERHEARLVDLKAKIAQVEEKMGVLARKAGLEDGQALARELEAYATAPPQLKELDMLQQLIAVREGSLSQLRKDLEPYFRQCRRDIALVTGELLQAMAQDAAVCQTETQEIELAFEQVRAGKEQIDFLVSELTSIEEILAQLFANAGMENPTSMDDSYTEFYGNIAAYQHLQALREQLDTMRQRYSFEIGEEDLGSAISRLEKEKREAWERIQYLVQRYPEIADQSPPDAEQAAQLARDLTNPEVEMLRNERDRLRAEVRAFFEDYDANYASKVDELSKVEGGLSRAKTNKLALELARDRINILLGEDLLLLGRNLAVPRDSAGEALPLFIDAAILPQGELELAIALKFITSVVAESRQLVLISNSRRVNLGKFMQPTVFQQQPLKFCLRTPFGADGFLQHA